jgi:hypothetical protein
MVVAVVALVVASLGTAYAALAPKSVGKRQLKAGAVTNSKVADEAVTTAQVAKRTLTGASFDLSALGKVPSASSAGHATTAGSLDGGHSASCPAATKLIHGLCFDAAPSGPVTGVTTAADKCAAAGGYLPTVSELMGAREALSLGDGNGTHAQFTDSYFYADPSGATELGTRVVSSAGAHFALVENGSKEVVATFEYTCVYPLVR